ncbi:ABC transporter ATP-binding protein [Conexibacter sp. CPCC 206217]|uniref:ABC transporter ATP-binding protein n=1 Tax=Conexibacter sp. CPCC 206217 TaxID=3064574 RepID=UPI0027161C45|nr:ABC transporter ATP-binding protein [Conexibacter sp. CPCC 206217]MDO8208804.1 ABC transporter ATP-binding protein [Conexibacter sp. CPCC 206217]
MVPPADPLLQVAGLTVAFGGVHALQDVSLDVARGETLGLIGPNGAGKTTFLNAATGFVRPTAGTIRLAGTDVTRLSAHRRARSGLARTFQDVRLFGALSARDNVAAAAIGAGSRRRAAELQADRLLDRLDLGDRADVQASALAYGDARRLSIARALAIDPQVLMLDEPAAGLNDSETRRLGLAVRAIVEQHACALVVVEHDIDFIMSVCTRIHVLDHGRTLTSGDPATVRADPQVVASYFGARAEVPSDA